MIKSSTLSYQSAGVFPVKLLMNKEWVESGKLRPLHLQIYPTNRCNANCPFCSCADRDRTQELPWEFLKREICKFAVLGGQAVTLTGGGEPLLYPQIEELLDLLFSFNIKIGMMTNGILLDSVENIGKLTWCRISAHNNFNRDIIDKFDVDWSLSYVWDGDKEKVQELVEFVNSNERITHLRIVNNINNPEVIPKFDNDEKVVYQNRENFDSGAEKCWMGIVKPLLNADGFYYPCCGVQYATEVLKQVPVEMKIGNSIEDIFNNQKPFDGSVCEKCYYKNYNDIFNMAKSDIKHLEFI